MISRGGENLNNQFQWSAILFYGIPFLISGTLIQAADSKTDADPQYELGEISITAASDSEDVLKNVSAKSASHYLEIGAKGWSKNKSCVSCHTNGTYLLIRPELSKQLGPPSEEIREFFLTQLEEFREMPEEKINRGTNPAGVIYIAAGLAQWDKHLNQEISQETTEAIEFMLSLQQEKGTWSSATCWPPFESSSYQLATMAAMALGDAPGWQNQNSQSTAFQKLKTYLTQTTPPHDYGKVLLLWASTRIPNLLKPKQTEEIIKMIRSKQHEDGGWAIRDFAKPEEWGQGNRAEKLKSEPEFHNPPSDGHQTGLAVIVLLDAGVPVDDPQIQKAVNWLKSNQRSSGRWWTRSLNTDNSHYITYSATCYALLALARCGELPSLK